MTKPPNLGKGKIMWRIILPQAMRIIVVDTNLAPAVINPAAAKAAAAVAPSAEAEPSLKMDFPEDEAK
ncbi:hypothetical protein OIT41_02450 [Arthrobacter sp. YA7-1]|uniref:hypothetical protein n=1 Tax=Arthrobacter sp. YA7-1 TaxID=2987701 RepID=UPI0022278E29|nr:hypothetical protein [Arthrobacter sp. YA7-1]UYY81957.1 hypothetical protein OIT41_02450 [Arthrobacter sp. YA7-1]